MNTITGSTNNHTPYLITRAKSSIQSADKPIKNVRSFELKRPHE